MSCSLTAYSLLRSGHRHSARPPHPSGNRRPPPRRAVLRSGGGVEAVDRGICHRSWKISLRVCASFMGCENLECRCRAVANSFHTGLAALRGCGARSFLERVGVFSGQLPCRLHGAGRWPDHSFPVLGNTRRRVFARSGRGRIGASVCWKSSLPSNAADRLASTIVRAGGLGIDADDHAFRLRLETVLVNLRLMQTENASSGPDTGSFLPNANGRP